MNENPLVVLARAANDWRTRELSPDVLHDTRRAVLDWFAAMLPGCAEGPSVPLARALDRARGDGRAIAYVTGTAGSARHAALLNGVASHTVEFDDIFRDGGYHPGSPTIAAALAVAQDEGASPEAFHRAVIGGYEVGCRIALALQPSHYRNWHITATVGTIGAAVATAMLKGCGAEGIGNAIAIASSFAGGHQENLQGQGQTKPLHCGHAAEAGVLAGLAAAEGITGSPDSLHAAHGYAAATSDSTGNWDAALQGLGEWTPISRMTFKNHGCCGHIFPTLDGLRAALAKRPFGPDDVARIEVQGYGPTALICDRVRVETTADARFSVQYCVAALLYMGAVRLAAFAPDAMARADMRAFMPKVSVAQDAGIAAAYPARRQARLVITLTTGEVLTHFQPTRKGDPDDPLSDAELFEKYQELATEVLDKDSARHLRETIMSSDRLPGSIPLQFPKHPAA
ncbi:MmgE/PrpD family protein [Roseinatronobacter alkalisoli]|uniref:MmgE/PrpD family protein n=1 Tax=Roseinatronobacter alkalisoli TaxID=3028235 RepID=A0ABT5TDM1_9RHOB|nr:MmgE/PrpD family protein [Roseinatronobacter sp. HJB301]MDD7973116.1 MmgE/PrpD family protein [Roseinatronobacter sp. HJB301]